MVQNIHYITKSNLYAMVAVEFLPPMCKRFIEVNSKMISCFSIRLDAYLSQHDTQPQGKYNLHSISDEKYYV